MKFLILALILSLNYPAYSKHTLKETPLAQLKYSMDFILNEVLLQMHQKPDPTIALPDLKLASQTTLADFQNDIEKQWNFKPGGITNAYVAASNRIYLWDDLEYYQKHKRCLDDSLAHELVHYVQVQYQKIPISQFDDFMESEAIHVQNAFREKFCPL